MKKISIFILLLILAYNSIAQPGKTCSNAILLASDTTFSSNDTITSSIKWYKFVASTTLENIAIKKIASSLGHIHKVTLFSGTCASLVTIKSDTTTDSILFSGGTYLTVGNYYYIKIEHTDTTAGPLIMSMRMASGSAGAWHSLFVCASGNVYATGNNTWGQLGIGTYSSVVSPTLVSSLSNVIAVSAGEDHSLALLSSGTVMAWGNNIGGQLGDGTTITRNIPVAVSLLTNVIAISTGNTLSLALKNDGTVWAWGYNVYGQLGDGTTISRSTPVQVLGGLSGVTAISAGEFFSLALKSNGTVWAWGSNAQGQLGNNTLIDQSLPVNEFNGFNNITAIATGTDYSLILNNSGTVYGSGDNTSGPLGNGTTTSTQIFTLSSSVPSGMTSISAGSHSLAVRNDGTAWGWGSNFFGQLGIGSTTSSLSVTQVPGLSCIRSVSAGYQFSLFTKTNGTEYSCGDNSRGQLGDGTITQRTSPVSVTLSCPVAVPAIPIAGAGSICSGSSTSLTASGGALPYTWTGAGLSFYTGSTVTATPTSTTTYTVTDACMTTGTHTVIVNPTPNISNTLSNDTECAGTSISSITITGSVAGTTYNWTNSNVAIGLAASGSGIIPAFIATNTTGSPITATITITPSTAYCTGTPVSYVVTVKPSPTITASATPSGIFLGSSTTLHSSSSTGTYNWSPGATLSSTTVSSPTATPSVTTTYTVSTTNSYGCPATATTAVTVTNAECSLHINTTINTNSNSTTVFGTTGTPPLVVSNTNIYITSGVTLNINNDITFTGCNFLMESGSKIVVNANLTLTISDKTHMFSCSDMWDGIYVIGQGKVVIKSDAFIEDALNAVVSQTGGQFTINTAIFNKNLKAVDVQTFAAAHPGTMVNSVVTSRYIPSYVSTGNISNYSAGSLISHPLTGFAAANMISPNTSFKGVYGVVATNVSSIHIGAAAASSTNTFDAIMCGIYLISSDAVIFNNRFQYLLNPNVTLCVPGPCYNVTGFGVKAVGTSSGTNSVKVGGTSTYQGNSFYSCYRAVELTDYQTNLVLQNSIDNASTTAATSPAGYGNVGIYVKPASNNTVTITGNAPVKNCATAIWLNRAFTSAASTNALQIDNNGTAANPITADASGYCINGIYVTDLAATPTTVPTAWEISGNVITETANCIFLQNVKRPVAATSNSLYTITSNSCQVHYATTGTLGGIEAKGCSGLAITLNHTKYNSTAAYASGGNLTAYGIYLEGSSNMLVKCNQIDDAARSLTFYGTCTSTLQLTTAPYVGITENTMHNAQDGFVLLTSGIIGSQGNSTTPIASNNYWDPASTFSRSQTYTDGTTGANTGSKLYMNSGTSTLPTNNQTNVIDPYTSTGGTIGLNIITGGAPSACGSVPALVALHSSTRDVLIDTTYANELVNMIEDTITLPVYSYASHWQRRNFAYNEIKRDGNLRSNTTLDNFYTANATTAFGNFSAVQDEINNADYASANSINNNVLPDNILEQNQQTVNQMILLQLSDTNYVYTDTDTSTLYAVANQCPVAGGNAVYQARNLLMAITNNVIAFPDNCDEKPKQLNITSESNSKNSDLFKLYPNPNNGSMTLEYVIKPTDVALIKLFDITGKEMDSYAINANTDKLQIGNNKLNNGIYFYQIIVNNKTVKQDKLIIIK